MKIAIWRNKKKDTFRRSVQAMAAFVESHFFAIFFWLEGSWEAWEVSERFGRFERLLGGLGGFWEAWEVSGRFGRFLGRSGRLLGVRNAEVE